MDDRPEPSIPLAVLSAAKEKLVLFKNGSEAVAPHDGCPDTIQAMFGLEWFIDNKSLDFEAMETAMKDKFGSDYDATCLDWVRRIIACLLRCQTRPAKCDTLMLPLELEEVFVVVRDQGIGGTETAQLLDPCGCDDPKVFEYKVHLVRLLLAQLDHVFTKTELVKFLYDVSLGAFSREAADLAIDGLGALISKYSTTEQ